MIPESRIDSVRVVLLRGKNSYTHNIYLDLQHHSFRIMLDGKLNLAPVNNPQRVLDLATGTGIWAVEFGSSLPVSISI
jgi:ubiquinone/menaquinone biosynthesis C-methylase UbiE